jgi:hypothetical protein
MNRVAWMASGALVWALHFASLYGFTALACARGFAGAVPWFAGAASLAAFATIFVILARNLPRRAEFEHWVAGAIAALGLIGIVFQTVPVYWVRPCA